MFTSFRGRWLLLLFEFLDPRLALVEGGPEGLVVAAEPVEFDRLLADQEHELVDGHGHVCTRAAYAAVVTPVQVPAVSVAT